MASSAASTKSALTRRDRALLAAVAAGRCALTAGPLPSLLIDGRGACDQLAAYQLLAAGFIRPAGRVGQLFEVELTEVGRAATKP
jgi:hypothetical protein